MQKIIKPYTDQMEADETVIRIKLNLTDSNGRSKAIAHAIQQWAQQIKTQGREADAGPLLADYVEEFVRGSYVAAAGQRVNVYIKDELLADIETIGDHLATLQNDVPMLLPVLKPSGARKASAYNTTLIITLALAREARGAK